MAKYKPDQGPYARTSALWLLGSLWVFGCVEYYYWLYSFRDTSWLVGNMIDGNLPVLGLPLTGALLIAVGVGLGGMYLINKWLNSPKAADMLINSETEMRKCTWPSWGETFNSSIVIVVVMLAFTALLAGMDYVLNVVMTEYVF